MPSKPDFAEVGSAALEMAHVLLPEWLGGKRQGHEWQGETRSNGGLGNSWAVNLDTGAWLHGAGDEKGGDLVSLYAALNHIKQAAALKEVALQVGLTERRPPKILSRAAQSTQKPAERVPLSAPQPTPHPTHGEPTAIYRYGDAFWVCRYDFGEGEKLFRPFTWRKGHWEATGYPEPRPIYHLTEIMQEPDVPVLVVEGEKCADAASGVMRGYITTTWANGAQSVTKNAWEPLFGRDVLIWPDADEPGLKAAATLAELLTGHTKRLRVIQPNGQPPGWDIADAIAEGWDSAKIAEWAKTHVKEITPVVVESPPPAVVEDGDNSALVTWQSLKLDCGEGGQPHATVANVSMILQAHPDFRERVWHDTFTDQIRTTMNGCVERRWTDADDLNLTVFIQQSLRLNKVKQDMVASGVLHAARLVARNSLTDWLDSLEWDGVVRLETWLADTLGCDNNEYTTAVAVNWPISMVARAYVPGCKVDTMPVLEGAQGMSKSTFLEVLGDPWYGSIPIAFGDKDFLQAIQGHWLVEIPDMSGFSRREQGHILATMSIRNDIYRASYGHHTVNHPRVTVFAATSETDDYLQDARGRRRYWPLRCTEINIDVLREQREQIFAEARDRYREGAKWFKMPGMADEEQADRAAPDLWTDRVIDYATELWTSSRAIGITSARILSDAIELPLAKQTDVEKRRIARIMRENGWIQRRDAYGRKWRKAER